MGWILLQIVLLFSLHITTAFAEQEQNKEIPKIGHHSLGSFLKNVLDSSQELIKIQDEVKANEELEDAIHKLPVNNEYNQPRQKRKAKVIPEVKVAGKAARDPHTLRRVLNLYMKRAQMFRYGKGENLIEDSQQKLSESHKEKRQLEGMYVVFPPGYLQKNADEFGQGYKHKQSSERNKIRRRRWRGKSQQNEVQNSNNEKSSSIVNNKIDIVNTEAAAASDIPLNYPLSNMVQKGTSNVQYIASYQENTLPNNSMISKRSDKASSSVNSPSSVVPGSGYDLDCVHEIPSLKESLLSSNFKGPSSLTDNFSEANDLRPMNDIALNDQETPRDSKSAFRAQIENLSDQQPLNEMENKQELSEASEQASFNSDGSSSGEALDIVNPIVLEVLEMVSKANNDTVDTDDEIFGEKRLAAIKNMKLPEAHKKNKTKTFSTENSSGQKTAFIKNKYNEKTKDSADKNKVASLGSLYQNSHENNLVTKQPSRSKASQMSQDKDLKSGQSVRSKTFQMSHENYLSKSLSNSVHDLSGKSSHKQERVPISNTKGKVSQTQKSKWSESSSVHKTPNLVNRPAATITNSAQKGLTHSGQHKIENVVAPIALYSKNHASLPKTKLDSNIILRTQLLHGSKNDKVSITQPKTQNKAKDSEVSLRQKTNIKQKANTVEETSRIQKKTKAVKLKDDINKRNSREINGDAPKQQTNLAFSESILGENENIKPSNGDGTLLTSENHAQVDSEEAAQGENIESNHQLININKRSEEKQQEGLMSGDAQNVVQENELSAAHHSKFREPLRRKRYASRFRRHLRKGKRQYRQEGGSKLNSGGKYAPKDFSPYKYMAKHTDGENREDGVHKNNMLRQVEDMILALKEENHKARSKYGSGFSRRIGRRLHSFIDETRDNSDGSSDNDDYYYYDESDVDKRRPEHSKVSQKLNRKENLGKLDPTSLREKQMSVQKPFGGTEYLNTENPTNIDYSDNNDSSLNHIPSGKVFSDLITSESNKISLFDKEMSEEVLEARYNRSITQNDRGKDYEENVMENNPKISSLRRTDEGNQNSSTDKNNPRRLLRKNILANENQQATRLDEGQLEQLNNALNEIVLNHTATSWDEIGQDEMGYNAHMRYKRAGDMHEMDPSLKHNADLNVKKGHIVEETTRIEDHALEKGMNLRESVKESTTLESGNLSKIFNLEKEDKNCKTEVSQTDILPIKNSPNVMANKSNTLNDTALNYAIDFYNRHNNDNKHTDEFTESNWKTGENKKVSTTNSAVEIPVSKNNGMTDVIFNVQNAVFNVSGHSNAASKTEHTLQNLPNFGLFIDANSRGNYNNDVLPKEPIHLENINRQHEGGSKESRVLQKFNSPKYSYNKKNIEHKINKNTMIEENMLNNGIPGNKSAEKITENHENSRNRYEIADAKARGNIARYESLITKKQHLAEILQDSILSPDSMTKVKEMSLGSSKILLRNKRNDKDYIAQTLEEQPDDIDYSSGNKMEDYTHENSSTGDDRVILDIVLDTTKSKNESTFSRSTNTNLDAIQRNNTLDNSTHVTTMDARESLPTSKWDQRDSDKRNAENTVAVEYQSFNMPKDFNDDSQLNITINGALANKMVDLVFETVKASEKLKQHLGDALKKTDYGSQEKQPSYETGISQEMLEKEEEQYHQKTGSLLSKVMELLDVLVEEEVSKRSCISLQPDLREFLLWMLELPEPGKIAPSEFSVPDNFLFMKQNKRPHNKTKENENVSLTVSKPNQNVDLKKLNQQAELLRELIAQYLQLPDSEKAQVNYVYSFLTEQLQALERFRRSEILGFRSKVDDSTPSKSRFQGTRRVDADLKNAESTQSKLRYKGKHNLPNEAPFKDSKSIASPKEDNSYSKMTLEHEKSSFRHPSYDSEGYRFPNKNSFKTSSDKRSANKWSKSRQHLIKDIASELENVGTSESYNPVHNHNAIRPHQRKRRYGGHGHGGSKNKHRNITHLHVPTMRYRKLLKRAAEFRERSSLI